MSGSQLINTLKELQYPNAENLDPQDLDWLFDNEALASFLEWFCNNVGSSNTLDPSVLAEFKKLESSSEAVLEGRQLQEALQNFSSTTDETISEDALREEVEQLSRDIQECKKRKNTLIQKRNRLRFVLVQLLLIHHTGLSHRLSKLSAVEAKVKSRYKKCLEQTHQDNTEMNNTLDKLIQTVSRLNSLYEPPSKGFSSESTAGRSAMFLSQVPLQEYYGMEEKFTKELTVYTKKQFEGIADIASGDEGSRFQILEVSDPDSLLVRGQPEEVNISECKELARLQALFPKSELQRIDAACVAKRIQSELSAGENLLEDIRKGQFAADINKLRIKLQENQSALHSMRKDIAVLAENEIPMLVQESKADQVIRVLTGDYNLKLSRQDYFTSNQDKLISQLVVQRSRNEFLTMAFEVEARRHRDTHRLLTAVHQRLDKQLKSWKERMAVMGDGALTPSRHQRGTVDSRDKSTARLYYMLEPGGESQEKQLFLTYASLQENADKLQQNHQGLNSALISANTKQEDRISALESNFQKCESMVYAGSSTTSGQPLLTPRALFDSMTQLEDMLNKLEQAIKDLVKDVGAKKTVLKNDPLLEKQRKLFVYFFTNPAKMHQALEDLSSRLQAQNVH